MDLSALTYKSEIDLGDAGYDFFKFFEAEPDHAIVAAVDGYCFAAYRGSILSVEDWMDNLQPGMSNVCSQQQDEQACCEVRSGFYDGFNSGFRKELEASLPECIEQHALCDDDDDDDEESCVVFTGFSHGGAIAHVSALHIAHLKPRVITFGQPATVQLQGCEHLLPSDRIYRWVNTFNDYLGQGLLAYDIVATMPFFEVAGQFGHMLVLPPDNSAAVAYFGLDPPSSVWQARPGLVMAHVHKDIIFDKDFHAGYREHLTYLLINANEYSFIANGFVDGSLCREDYECQSNRCQKQLFASNLCA